MRMLMLGLAIMTGMASAVPLYTVTLKMAPVFDRSEFLVAPTNPAFKKLYSLSKKGQTATFRLPAGEYTFYVSEPTVKPERYGVGSVKTIISGNRTLTIPTDPWPVMDATGRAAFNRLLIAMGGASSDCPDPMADVSELCAEVPYSTWNIVKSYVRLKPEFVQTVPWNHFTDTGYSGKFTIGSIAYSFLVFEHEDGVDLNFSRVK